MPEVTPEMDTTSEPCVFLKDLGLAQLFKSNLEENLFNVGFSKI